MLNLCTLFDSHYLTRGLAMYRSLVDIGESFHLYIFCFDDEAYEILTEMKLLHITLISLSEFESPELLSVKSKRNRAEYCWTCTPHVIAYSFENFYLSEVVYIDADLFFYDKPSILLEELKDSNDSILLTRHNFSRAYANFVASGIYCVQFLYFRSDDRGLNALRWWQERCLEWCYARAEDGKFGDQKYLDDWTERFEGVHVLEHIGGGVAPWNVQNNNIHKKNSKIFIDNVPLVFYHFHNFRIYKNGIFYLGNYRLSREVVDLIYRPYRAALDNALESVRTQKPEFDSFYSYPLSHSLLWHLARFIRGERNIYKEL